MTPMMAFLITVVCCLRRLTHSTKCCHYADSPYGCCVCVWLRVCVCVCGPPSCLLARGPVEGELCILYKGLISQGSLWPSTSPPVAERRGSPPCSRRLLPCGEGAAGVAWPTSWSQAGLCVASGRPTLGWGLPGSCVSRLQSAVNDTHLSGRSHSV